MHRRRQTLHGAAVAALRAKFIVSRRFRFLFVALSILLIAQRSPAPISEETPVPKTEQPAKPKPKRKTTSESSETKTRAPAAMATPIQNKFDGTWMGTLNNLPFAGNVDFTLLVSGSGTAVIEKSVNYGTHPFQVNCDGSTMRWETGASWTLTPNPDGQTALITCNSGGFFGVGAFSLSTVFRRTSTTITQTSAPVITNTSGPAPVAKAVPDRPGFVYNPFDPTSRILLDVRGKASGTKLIEPKSGRLFVVP
jgi:hypothetical protein